MSTEPLVLQIPSIHHRTELHCRIYHPADGCLRGPRKLGAIIAHPWASFGGSYDDPAVLAAVFALVEKGYVVGTFNFRGAKPSGGTTSWSGKPEVSDYISFVGFFVHYLKQLKWEFTAPAALRRTRSSSAPQTPTTPLDDGYYSPARPGKQPKAKPGDWRSVLADFSSRRRSLPSALLYDRVRKSGPITLILGGYSYGAVILSNLPSLDHIVEQFVVTTPQSVEHKIVETASLLSAHTNAKIHHARDSVSSSLESRNPTPNDLIAPRKHPKAFRAKQLVAGGMKRSRKPEKFDRETWAGVVSGMHLPRHSQPSDPIETWYLFISPVVGSLKRFLHWGRPANDDMWNHRVLVVHGSKDHFTSVNAVDKWVRNPRAEVRVVENGHLWIEPHTRNALMKLIGDWASRDSRPTGLKRRESFA